MLMKTTNRKWRAYLHSLMQTGETSLGEFESFYVNQGLHKFLVYIALHVKMKIWRRQNLQHILVAPNKFCQPSAAGPILSNSSKLSQVFASGYVNKQRPFSISFVK